MGEEQHIFMKTNKMENILIKFWTFDYGCVLRQFKKKMQVIFSKAMFGLRVK
jgi:hypothetical protein